MNWKTTLALLVLAAGGAGVWYGLTQQPAAGSDSESLKLLAGVTDKSLTRIEIDGDPKIVLEKVNGDWTLPGNWPARKGEIDRLVQTLTHLHSRFTPKKLNSFAEYGLDRKALTVKLTVDGKPITLLVGEQPADDNAFTRPTWVRVDSQNEVVRLGPGVRAILEQPLETYRQRRLFPVERIALEDSSTGKVEAPVAESIKVTAGTDPAVELVKHKDGWKIEAPLKDNVDPEKLQAAQNGLLDLWADNFVTGKKPEETGLDKPEYKVEVKRPGLGAQGGGAVTLEIGKVSKTLETKVVKTPPAPPFRGMPPPKPTVEVVKEEYRYAKLADKDPIFEIKATKLKDLAVPLADLRDARVLRFKPDDVKSLTIDVRGKTVVLAKDGDSWKMEKPYAVGAEREPITELLDKLAALDARGKNVLDEDAKKAGLTPFASITLNLEEGKKEAKTNRTVTLKIGENPADKKQLLVEADDRPRINVVPDDILKLVDRDVLAYRQKRLLDKVAAADLASIQLIQGDKTFTFTRKDGTWSQSVPSAAKLEQKEVDQLAGDLTRVAAAEFVTAAPTPEDLDAVYGLAKPALKAVLTFTDEKKPAETLLIGKQRTAKDDFFARFENGPVFVVKKDIRDLLEKNPLSFRPTQAWTIAAKDVTGLKVTREGQPFTLKREGDKWTVEGPFTAPVRNEYVDSMVDDLADLKSEKYVAQLDGDLKKFGLEKPYLRFEVSAKVADKAADKEKAAKDKDDKKDDKNDKDKKEVKEKIVTSVLEIGGPVGDAAGSRYARVGDGDVLFLVSGKVLAVIDRGPLELLDRVLMRADGPVTSVNYQAATPFTLELKKKEWWVVKSPAPDFLAEDDVVRQATDPLHILLASKIAAYGPKIDWKEFGLEKPETTITVTSQGDEKKDVTHTIALGKDAGNGARYIRVDQQPQVAVVEANIAESLAKTYLDFVDPRVLKFDFDAVVGIGRAMAGQDVDLSKTAKGWELVKPGPQPADAPTVDEILQTMFRLKAVRVAAYPAKNLKAFGLEPPAATVTLDLKGMKHVINVGGLAGKDGKGEERYAQIDNQQMVVVLPAKLSRVLAAPALAFADRTIAEFDRADAVLMVRGARTAEFTRSGGDWSMVKPVKAETDPALGDFILGLRKLRADEIVAGKEADAKDYGLDPPLASWTLSDGGKKVLDLLIGGPEKGKEKDPLARHYARLAGGGPVFLLSPLQTAEALGEPRDRRPWPPLDAAQITGVSVIAGPKSFTLSRRGAEWSIKEMPGEELNTKAVVDLLDALAGLKAERYIADTKADLQLHGLDKPAMKIELTTPAGSRTLILGRTEGDSKRVYATVPGSDAVFLIGEADVQRLTRPATAYAAAKKP